MEISFLDSSGHRVVFSHPHYDFDGDVCVKFPDVDTIVPTYNSTFEIALNPKLLRRIARHAIKVDEDCKLVFRFKDAESAVLIELQDSIGFKETKATYVLMPMHSTE